MVSVSSATQNQQNSLNTNSSLAKLNEDFTKFLTLLTTQLQNQDPTQPLDTNQLTDQITQLSQVEQQINTNKGLERLLAASQTSAINSAVSYVDRFVEHDSAEFHQRTGTSPLLTYKLPEQAASVSYSITDSTGRVLFSKDISANGGTAPNVAHAITWDGKDSNGNVLPTGKYKVSINAKNREGADIKATTTVTDIVTEVALEDNEIMLTMGDIKIPASKVKSIKGYYAEVKGNNTGGTGNTGGSGNVNENAS